MNVFNGIRMGEEGFNLAHEIQRETGLWHLPDGFNIAPVKGKLRRLYTLNGGKRGGSWVDPSTAQLRALYNGETSAARLFAELNPGHKAEGKAEEKAPEAEKAPEIVTEEADPDAAALAKALAAALAPKQKLDPDAIRVMASEAIDAKVTEIMAAVPAIVEEAVAKAVSRVEIKVGELPKVEFTHAHEILPTIIRAATVRTNIMLVGPAGSGKTTLAKQVSEALGLEFYASGAIFDSTDLLGFINGGGTYMATAFRRAYEGGGVFLFDEIDGSSAEALLKLNAALAGPWMDFPDGMVKRHPDFVAIAAANTFGRGADRQYVGRQQLDAASLDRFVFFTMNYDEKLETALATNAKWCKHVQKARKALFSMADIRHVVSPRATIDGGKLLAAGLEWSVVEEAVLWKGLNEVQRNRIIAAMR